MLRVVSPMSYVLVVLAPIVVLFDRRRLTRLVGDDGKFEVQYLEG